MNAPRTVSGQIKRRIEKAGPGWVFTPFDFLDLASARHVGVELTRLQRSGAIRRLVRGIYDAPQTHPRLGVLAPDPEAIAQALARRDSGRIQPSDAMAANMLRLSEQVPARPIYKTDGRSRTVKIGKQTIELRNAAPRKLRANPASNLVFAALRGIGRQNVTERRVAHLRSLLGPADRKQLLKDLPLAPAWMHPFVRFIAVDATARAEA
ncbi:MAG: hypothetical protein HY874_06650 [Chloroflexi bacterium]|nr:hypothetical protein [Chloroflexota bacterium]